MHSLVLQYKFHSFHSFVSSKTNKGVLNVHGDVTALPLGLGPQSALAGTAKSLRASTVSRTIHLCTSSTTGCAIFYRG